jgi:hypothetical protein
VLEGVQSSISFCELIVPKQQSFYLRLCTSAEDFCYTHYIMFCKVASVFCVASLLMTSISANPTEEAGKTFSVFLLGT